MNDFNKYDDTLALEYEYLICDIYKCDRNEILAASADLYRRCIRSANMYYSEKEAISNGRERRWGTSVQEMRDEYLLNLGELNGYLRSAFSKFSKENAAELKEEQKLSLRNIQSLVVKPSMENVIQAVEKSVAFMQRSSL